MASIGNVSFGISSDSEAIERTIKRIEKFRKVVNDAGRGQSAAAKKTQKTLAAQESQVKKNLKSFRSLAQSMKNTQGEEKELARDIEVLEKALSDMSREMTAGEMATHNFKRSQDAFAKATGDASRAVNQLKSDRAAKSMKQFNVVMRDLESASVLAIGPLSGLGARIRAMSAIMNRSTRTMTIWFGALTAGAVAIWKFSAAALNAAKVSGEMMARFTTGTGSIEGAMTSMDYATSVALKYGLSLEDVGKAYSKLVASSKGSVLAGKQTRELFEALSMAAAALRLDPQAVEGAFKAVEQMMSKGTVAAEELRGQLAERLPGAFAKAAKAMGVFPREFNKMLKAGEITAERLLPELTKVLKGEFEQQALDNVDTYAGAINNVATNWYLLAKAVDDYAGVSDKAIILMKGLSSLMIKMRQNINDLVPALLAAGIGLSVFYMPAVITGIKAIYTGIRAITLATLGLNAAMLANPFGAFLSVVIRLTAAIAAFVISFVTLKWLFKDVDEEAQSLEERLAALDEQMQKGVQFDPGEGFDKLSTLVGEMEEKAKYLRLPDGEEEFERYIKPLREIQAYTEDIKKTLGEDTANIWYERAHAALLDVIKAQDDEKRLEEESGKRKKALQKIIEDRQNAEERAINTTVEALRKAMALQEQYNAMQGGKVSEDYYNAVTKQVNKIRDAMMDAGVGPEVMVASLIELENSLDLAFRKQQQIAEFKAFQKVDDDVAKLNATVAAMQGGEEAFADYKNIEAKVAAVKAKLVAINGETAEVIAKTGEYRVALTALVEEQKKMSIAQGFSQAFEQVAVQIDVINDKIMAMGGGEQVVKFWEQVEKPVAAVRAKMIALGADEEEVVAKTEKLRLKYIDLYETQKRLDATKIFKDNAQEIQNIMAEIRAMQGGEESYDIFKDIDKPVAELRAALAATTNDWISIMVQVEAFEEALKALRAQQQQMASDKAFKSVSDDIDEMTQRLNAMRGGEAALKTYEEIDSQVNAVRATLSETEKDQAKVNAKVEEFKALLIAINEEAAKMELAQAFKDIEQQITLINLEIEAMNKGPEALDLFKGVDSQLVGMVDKFVALGAEVKDAELYVQMLRDSLLRLRDAEDKLELAETFKRAKQEIKGLQERLDMIRMGPQALEDFDKITLKAREFNQTLLEGGMNFRLASDMTREYKELLRQVVYEEENMINVGEQMANAFTNSFEDAILGVSSFKEALASLLQEIAKVILELLILQQLRAAIETGINAAFSTPAAPKDSFTATAGNYSPANGGQYSPVDVKPKLGFARGGAFTVGGSGGTDSQVVKFAATPGERVSIQTPSQAGGNGGGQVLNVTVNAPGADAGTIARIEEIVRVKMAPQIIKASTQNTLNQITRPEFS